MTEVFTPKILQQAQVNSILGCCHDDPEWLRMGETEDSRSKARRITYKPLHARSATNKLVGFDDYKSKSSKRVIIEVVARWDER